MFAHLSKFIEFCDLYGGKGEIFFALSFVESEANFKLFDLNTAENTVYSLLCKSADFILFFNVLDALDVQSFPMVSLSVSRIPRSCLLIWICCLCGKGEKNVICSNCFLHLPTLRVCTQDLW